MPTRAWAWHPALEEILFGIDCAPSGLKKISGFYLPRALPWAILFCPFRAFWCRHPCIHHCFPSHVSRFFAALRMTTDRVDHGPTLPIKPPPSSLCSLGNATRLVVDPPPNGGGFTVVATDKLGSSVAGVDISCLSGHWP